MLRGVYEQFRIPSGPKVQIWLLTTRLILPSTTQAKAFKSWEFAIERKRKKEKTRPSGHFRPPPPPPLPSPPLPSPPLPKTAREMGREKCTLILSQREMGVMFGVPNGLFFLPHIVECVSFLSFSKGRLLRRVSKGNQRKSTTMLGLPKNALAKAF